LEQTFPFDDNSFDLAFCFFTLEHIQNIENFFNETYRILSDDGQIFIGHFFQRREFEWTVNQKKFKIQQYKRSTEDIEKVMKESFFDVDIVPMSDK
jgi:ubiquinone/menaquinone biosynthesis C-methylase UbiE